MAGKDNLVVLSPEEARKNGQKGGRASGEARRKRKALRDCMETLLSLPPSGKEFDVLSQVGLCPEDMDKAMLAALAVFEKAKEGDVSAFREIRDLIGEKKAEKIDAEITVHLEGDVKDYAG